MVLKMRFRDNVLRVQIGFDSRKERFGFDLGKEKPIEKGLNWQVKKMGCSRFVWG